MAHALIIGASGISGWSLLNQTRTYPTETTFSRITGLTNRPFSLEQAQLPKDDRYQIVSGINLLKSVDEIAKLLKENVKDVETVSHVFFTAYIQESDHETLNKTNTILLENAVQAVEKVAPALKTFILQTGGKAYGVEWPKEIPMIPPFMENAPRVPEPYRSKIFYYTQYDKLKELSAGKPWTFTEIRPDGIVGFAPGSNFMNMGQGLAIYLSMFRKVHGKGAKVPFPGPEHGYRATHMDTFQDLLSRLEIFTAVNSDKCGNGAVFNAADGPVVTWADIWPKLCGHWGLEDGGPGMEDALPIQEFIKKNRSAWFELCKEHGLKESTIDEQGWGHLDFMMVGFDFSREFDLSNSRKVGFTESIDTAEGYYIVWDRMRKAKIVPPQ